MHLPTNNATITALRASVRTTTTLLQPTLSPTPSIVTLVALARNGIDQSDTIDIVFEVLGVIIALATLVVGIYFGRRQIQKHKTDRLDGDTQCLHGPVGVHHLRGSMNYYGPCVSLHFDHICPSRISDGGSAAASARQSSSDAIDNAREAVVHELV
ncbi:hypothetical protein LTR81_011452 [Elasticomyces elasticus]